MDLSSRLDAEVVCMFLEHSAHSIQMLWSQKDSAYESDWIHLPALQCQSSLQHMHWDPVLIPDQTEQDNGWLDILASQSGH